VVPMKPTLDSLTPLTLYSVNYLLTTK
jgi:hypothetical protein